MLWHSVSSPIFCRPQSGVRIEAYEGETVTITRRNALRTTVTSVVVSASMTPRLAQGVDGEGEQFFLRLLKSNDEMVGRLLKEPPAGRPRTLGTARGGVV